jgi:hypothetical protein
MPVAWGKEKCAFDYCGITGDINPGNQACYQHYCASRGGKTNRRSKKGGKRNNRKTRRNRSMRR